MLDHLSQNRELTGSRATTPFEARMMGRKTIRFNNLRRCLNDASLDSSDASAADGMDWAGDGLGSLPAGAGVAFSDSNPCPQPDVQPKPSPFANVHAGPDRHLYTHSPVANAGTNPYQDPMASLPPSKQVGDRGAMVPGRAYHQLDCEHPNAGGKDH